MLKNSVSQNSVLFTKKWLILIVKKGKKNFWLTTFPNGLFILANVACVDFFHFEDN